MAIPFVCVIKNGLKTGSLIDGILQGISTIRMHFRRIDIPLRETERRKRGDRNLSITDFATWRL